MPGHPLEHFMLGCACREYGWHPRRVIRVRGGFQVQADQGVFALKPFKGTSRSLLFLDRIHRYLQERGFRHVLPWVKTVYGDAFFSGKDFSYYATPWFGSEWSEDSPISTEALIESLAEMHRMTEGWEKELSDGEAHHSGKDSQEFDHIVERWQEQLKRMHQYADMSRDREFASPFERMFLVYFEELNQAASIALKGLKRVAENDASRPFRRVLCHQALHRHNVVVHEMNWKWIDFDHAGWAVPMRDLSILVQRFPPRGREEESPEALYSWLTSYTSVFPLRPRERQVLCLLLAYPEQVFRWVERYDRDKRSRDELFYVQGLEQDLRYFRWLKQFAKQSWPRPARARNKYGSRHQA